MPSKPLSLRTPKKSTSQKGKTMGTCRDCGGNLRHGKGERPEGARKHLCPDCFERFVVGFFR